MKKVLWTVGLSNGETIAEEKGNFKTIEGALSPWQRLLSYLPDAKATITSLSLYTNDGRRWNLPSAGKNPKFGELQNLPKPVDFIMQRKAAREAGVVDMKVQQAGDWTDRFSVAIAVLEDGSRVEVCVAEDTLASWSIIR